MDKLIFSASRALSTSRFFQVCFAPEDEGASGAEPAFDFAAPTEALSLDKGAQILGDSLRNEGRERESNGRFKGTEKPAEDDTKVVDLKTGKPPVAEEQPKAEADDDEDPEFEIPGEEGKEPTRRKLSELWDRFDKSVELEKEVETLRSQASQVPVEYTTGLQDAIQARGQYLKGLEFVSRLFNPVEPDPSLANPNHPNYNPDVYWAAKQAHDENVKAIQGLKAEHEQLSKEQRANVDAWNKAHLARERSALAKAWPESQNPEVSKQVTESLKRDYGFTPEEIAATTDHRMFLVIRDAMEFRASKAKQVEAVKVVRQKPKLVKGAARTTTDPKAAGRSSAMAKLAQTGSIHDAVAAVKGLI